MYTLLEWATDYTYTSITYEFNTLLNKVCIFHIQILQTIFFEQNNTAHGAYESFPYKLYCTQRILEFSFKWRHI